MITPFYLTELLKNSVVLTNSQIDHQISAFNLPEQSAYNLQQKLDGTGKRKATIIPQLSEFDFERFLDLLPTALLPQAETAGEELSLEHINEKHQIDLFEDRGLPRDWVAVNVSSISQQEASKRLGYTSRCAGMWLEGDNGYGQFRPDKAWKSSRDKADPKKKAPKYRTPTGKPFNVILPKHPRNPNYWRDFSALKQLCYRINGHPCIAITEGLFKALMGCAYGIPTISICGVEMGLTPKKYDPQEKRYLLPPINELAEAGFGFVILFDADAERNEQILWAQSKLGKALEEFDVPVYVGTGLWSEDEGKGMDDFIQMNGDDRFKREVMDQAVRISIWERQFNADNEAKSNKELAKYQASFAQHFAGGFRNQISWHVAAKAWYKYEYQKTGIWSEIPEEEAVNIVIEELSRYRANFTSGFVSGVMKLLKSLLRVNHWEIRPGFISLEDCILDINTLETHSHEPGYRMISQLPFKWADRKVGCDSIKEWLLEFCDGREDWVEVLRAGINATITERAGKLQRFVELIGAGGTGKGTLLRLVQALLGEDNYVVTNLKQLENNRFENAMLYGKKAVFITDSERYAGDVNVVKAITGDDPLRLEKKGVQQTGTFKFLGMVWVAANEAIQSTDYTNAFYRRRLSMRFDKVIPPHLRIDLEAEFKPYLAGFLAWVLEMSTEDMKRYLVDTARAVPSLGKYSKEVLLETNPLANWADEALIPAPGNRARIGSLKQSAEFFLYPHYCNWAEANGVKPVQMQRFSNLLENFLKTQAGLLSAFKDKDRTGAYITEVRLRQINDQEPLLVTELKIGDEESVTNESRTRDGFDGGDDTSLGKTEKLTLSNQTSLPLGEERLHHSSELPSIPPPSDPSPVGDLAVTESSPKENSTITDTVTNEDVPQVKPASEPDINPQETKSSFLKATLLAWSNLRELGHVVLEADEAEVNRVIGRFTLEQVMYLKRAANEV